MSEDAFELVRSAAISPLARWMQKLKSGLEEQPSEPSNQGSEETQD